MPSDFKGLMAVLEDISDCSDLGTAIQRQLTRDLLANFTSALAAGRACDNVTIVLLGETGQGKSATINKLVGSTILKTGDARSTTKEITRATVNAVCDGIKIPVSFVDTPGLNDSRAGDRKRNEQALARYAASFLSADNSDLITQLNAFLNETDRVELDANLQARLLRHVYPNAILLTAKWDRVLDEEDNTEEEFTTAIGHAMKALRESKLYDRDRPNVIILVTSAMLSPQGDLGDDFQSRWEAKADEKRKFIRHIQEVVFPDTTPWPIVFVENWSDPKKFGTYDFFPDKTQSHQNLFDALRTLFKGEVDAGDTGDLLGLESLATVIADAKSCGAVYGSTFGTDGRWGEAKERSAQPILLPPTPSAPLADLDRKRNGTEVGITVVKAKGGFWKQASAGGLGGLMTAGVLKSTALGAAVLSPTCVIQ